MNCYEAIRIDLHSLKELPPLTESSKKLLSAINDPDISLEILCEILEDNPPVTARLLVIANSAYFGYRRTIGSIRQAIIQVLGIKMVKTVALGILVADVLDTQHCKNFSSQRYWFSAVTVATLAKRYCTVAEGLSSTDPALAYTAGLLHNVGLLALVHKFPILMSSVLEESSRTDLSIAEILRRDYQLDQYQSGGWLARRWQFPESICAPIREQNHSNYTGQFKDLVTLVRAAAKISDDLFRENEPNAALINASANLGISQPKVLQIYGELQHQIEEIKTLAKLLNGNDL